MSSSEGIDVTSLSAKSKASVIPSQAQCVTFFEDRAEVLRIAQTEVEPGAHWLRIGGFSQVMDDRSLQVRLLPKSEAPETRAADASAPEALGEDPERSGQQEPGSQDESSAADAKQAAADEEEFELPLVASARVHRRVLQVVDYASEALAKLKEEVERLEAELRQDERALGQRQRDQARLKMLLQRWGSELSRVPRGGAEDGFESWAEAYQSILQRLSEAGTHQFAAGEKLKKTQKKLNRARARLGLRQSEAPRCDAEVWVQLVASQRCVVQLELKYRVPAALWRPEHHARLERVEPGVSTVTMATMATMWQRTGELWKGIEARFSTARTSKAASPPLLSEDLLESRRKQPQERRRIVIESRDEEIERVGGGGGGAPLMPGVDDGGVPLDFVAMEKVDIPSDGEPVRVEVGRLELEAEITRVLRAEKAPVAHFRAQTQLDSESPLLAGPLWIHRGDSLIGRTKLDFVGPQEEFELGFGPDDAVRVRRRVRDFHDSSAITGTKRIEFTVDLFLSNLSEERRELEISERIPVSEVEGLDISLHRAEGFELDEKDGILSAKVELEANQTLRKTLVYEVRAPSRMVLPF